MGSDRFLAAPLIQGMASFPASGLQMIQAGRGGGYDGASLIAIRKSGSVKSWRMRVLFMRELPQRQRLFMRCGFMRRIIRNEPLAGHALPDR